MSINWDKVVEENRLGKFTIDKSIIHNYPNYINRAMQRFIIVDGQFRYDTDSCRYVAYSPFFHEVDYRNKAPYYQIPSEFHYWYTDDLGERKHKWVINWQKFGRDDWNMPNIDKEIYGEFIDGN